MYQLTEDDKKKSTHITDGIYFKPLDSGACELFTSNGLTKNNPIIIDSFSVDSIIDKLIAHFKS